MYIEWHRRSTVVEDFLHIIAYYVKTVSTGGHYVGYSWDSPWTLAGRS
jgi:hypothetical protein